MIRKFMQIKLTNILFYLKKELLIIVMRTFIFLFWSTIFSLTPNNTFSQNDKIVIDADKKISVDMVFKIIKAQTDYSFVYHEDLFKDFPKIQLHKGVIRLNKLLSQSLSVGDINIIFTANNTILIKEIENNSKNQQFKVSGEVTDQSGIPASGATVLIKGTNKGTVTNLDGRYTITVPDPANVLMFSSLGFETKEIKVGNQRTINVSLKESLSPLDEITISGRYYNTSQRKETGSIGKIDAKIIEKQPVNNPLAAMQGHISGVDITQNTGLPGGGFQIQIRGRSFLDATENGFLRGQTGIANNPLYIVDGVPYNSESLESNLAGQIIRGAVVSPLNTLNPADIESIEVLKDADATAIYGARGANGVVIITTKKGKSGKSQIKIVLTSTLSEVSGSVDLMNTEQYLEMRIEAIENDGYTLETLPLFFQNGYPDLYIWDQERYTDWQEVLLGGAAYRRNAQLSFSGGNEYFQFLLNGGYTSETTVFPGDSKYEKASVHVNLNHQSKDKHFKINFSTNYVSDSNNLPGNDITQQALAIPPNAPSLYDEAGNINHWGNLGAFVNNPLTFLEIDYKAITRGLLANALLSYQIMPALEFKTSLGYQTYSLESYNARPHTFYNPNTTNGQSSLNGSSLTTNKGKRQSWIIEPQINFQKHWGKLGLELFVGTTFQYNSDNQLGDSGNGFTSNDQILNLDEAKTRGISHENESEYKYHAVFGRINFNWQDKYILNLTGRRDGSSKFGPGKRFGNFGAIGAAWLFSEENFLEDYTFLSFGKLRASYGITGSDNVGNYKFLDTYSSVNGGNYNGSGLQPTSLFNPNFAWEESKKIETAMELGFFKDRIFLTAAWYRNRSSNQLINTPLPNTTGFSGVNDNFDATVENKGFELDLRTVNVQNDHFRWSTTFNISTNKNKLVAFPGLEGSVYSKSLIIGQPLGIRGLFNALGVNPETGLWEFEDYNNDGVIDSEDNEWLLDITPKYFGGLGNTITYKNLKLDVFFQFTKRKGLKYVNSIFPAGGSVSNQPVNLLDRWQQPGDQNPIQRYFISNNDALVAAERYLFSNARVIDDSFVRLRSVSLNYTLPKDIIKGMDINIYLQGQNLFVLTKYDGPDPEIKSPQTLPPLRQFTLGLNLGF